MIMNKYFEDAPQKELELYEKFKKTYKPKNIKYKDRDIFYYSTSKKKRTILLLHGAMVTADFVYNRIMQFAEDFQVIAPTIRDIYSCEELVEVINEILKVEKVKKYIVFGGSFGGMTAQAIFKSNYKNIESMVLSGTLAPRPERCKNWALKLLKVLPLFLMRIFLKITFKKLMKAEIPEEAKDRYRFSVMLLKYIIKNDFNKSALNSTLMIAFDFNLNCVYLKNDFKDWKGKVLIIYSEDDSTYKDKDLLVENLPNNELYVFPKGSGHSVPVIREKEYLKIIRDFLAKA